MSKEPLLMVHRLAPAQPAVPIQQDTHLTGRQGSDIGGGSSYRYVRRGGLLSAWGF